MLKSLDTLFSETIRYFPFIKYTLVECDKPKEPSTTCENGIFITITYELKLENGECVDVEKGRESKTPCTYFKYF